MTTLSGIGALGHETVGLLPVFGRGTKIAESIKELGHRSYAAAPKWGLGRQKVTAVVGIMGEPGSELVPTCERLASDSRATWILGEKDEYS